jgi:hypothetical protein
MSLVRLRFACLCLAGLAACSPARVGFDEDGEPQHYSEATVQLQYVRPLKVDVLIVLDNSSSMAEEQQLLAQNVGALVHVLEAEDVEADYRIAITTTDAGHPSCPSSTPEHGAFMLTPCTSRLDEFVGDGEGGPSDVRALACTDICGLSAADLEILPTTTDEDPTPKPRPWIERIAGHSNLPEGVEMSDALSCFGPQGVAGCDFETPLESMRQALLRAKDPNDPAYGFLRKDAMVYVVFLTDEDDCSVAPGGEEIFSAEGDRLFWSDKDAAAATSAVCWNAGVACIGDPSGYDSCVATNKDLAGNEGVADQDAVLQPIDSYIELFDALMVDKLAIDPTQEPIIGIVGGAAANGALAFGDVGDTDPEFQQTFGIGPGCTGYSGDPDRPFRATPPARLAAVLEAMSPGNVFSICEDDWTPVLGVIAPRIHDIIYPACFTHCALDADAGTNTLEPDCIVEEHLPDAEVPEHIPECARDEHGYIVDPETNDYQLPPGIDVCHALLTDSTQLTADFTDDMSAECEHEGFNLEFKISRRPGHPAPGGTRVTATCSLSASPSLHCPALEN